MATVATTTTTTPDAQTWVFPPPGAATPPIAATGNFGPVHLNDSAVLEWEPDTKPEIHLSCFSQSDLYTTSIVAKLAAPPLTYQFTTPATSQNDTDEIFCHFFFDPSVMGNTVTWQFINESQAKAVTWSASPTSSTSQSSTASTPTSSSTPAATYPSGAPPAGNSSSLSSGARAGIGVGVTLGALFLLGALILFFASRRRKRRLAPAGDVKELDRKHHAHVKDPIQPVMNLVARPPAELDGTGVRRELP